jgi:Protein of unknown function (DUF2510)
MYDFESVSVSSYEAGSLAATLTEKSAEGWDVVAIVPAGSDVVAYLRRASEGAGEPAGGTGAQITDGTSNTIALAESTNDSPADLLTPTSVSSEPAVAETATSDTDITSPTSTPASSETGGTGWGASDDKAAGAAALGAAASGAAASEPSAGGWSSGADSSWSGSAQQAATPATPAVPAGWYADPAGRFELRYWDGSAWTEHVSRAGQQYTDPPVA